MIKKIIAFIFVFAFYQNIYSKGFDRCLFHICEERKFIYLVVPKTGYNSLITMITSNHLPLSDQIYTKIDLEQYPGYFTFAFVRNPWERTLSAYKNLYLHKKFKCFPSYKGGSFEDFIDYIATQDVYERFIPCDDIHIKAQSALIPEKVEFIGRFENLENDIRFIMSVIGLEDQEILHENQSEHDHYSHYYNERTKQIIAEKYKEDIERFGYEFESDSSSIE